METESGEFYTFTHTHASDLFIYSVLSIHSLGATRFWKGVMQGSWSLETTVLKPLLLGYTLQLLTRYKRDRSGSWLRPSVPISKGLYTHRGNRPISLPTITGLAWSEGWFGRVDSDPDPQSFLPSEYEQSEWDWHGLVRRGGLIIHTLRIENSSGRL